MVHEAGELDASGVQLCRRCGCILTDYRFTMVPDGTPPLAGWAVGASVEITAGNPRYSGVTTDPPDCQAVH